MKKKSYIIYLVYMCLFLSSIVLAYESPLDLNSLRQANLLSITQDPARSSYVYALRDPLTNELISRQAPVDLIKRVKQSTVSIAADGSQFTFYSKREFNILHVGSSVYDPCVGSWVQFDKKYDPCMEWSYYTKVVGDGMLGYWVEEGNDTPRAASFNMAIYEPALSSWVHTKIIPDYTPMSIPAGLVAGSVGLCRTNCDGGNQVIFSIYDPVRQEWKTHKIHMTPTPAINMYCLINYTLYSIIEDTVVITLNYNNPIVSPTIRKFGYNHASGQWVEGTNTTPVASFRVGNSYSQDVSRRTVWLTDMSIGGNTRVINWGDGSIVNQSETYVDGVRGSAIHTYATPQNANITITVSNTVGVSSQSTTVFEVSSDD